jgi:UDP-N-acetylmuramoyl-L-alanyl-D-glutamate--2,6-diaminopimelate ligase
LKIEIDNQSYKYITDNSKECNHDTAYFLCEQNGKYLEDAKAKNPPAIVTAQEYKKLLDIDDVKLIGITGTNGKTTTAGAIYSILLDLGYPCAMQGTRGVFINDEKLEGKTLTTPLIFNTLNHIKEAKNRGCKFFVMEVSSHAIEQNRIEGLEFALKIYTNLTQDHLDYHKTFKEYKRVKESFFLDESPKLINKDARKIEFNIRNAYTYALDLPATFNVTAYTLKDGISAAIRHFDKMETFHSHLHGTFNVYNLLAAVSAVSLVTKEPLNKICDAVENFGGVSGRMEVVSQDPLVIVDFAHTPDGMKKVLESFTNKDIICVFGAGGDRDRTKRPIMGKVASEFCQDIIITSDNPRFEDPDLIVEDILKGITKQHNVTVELNRKKAIQIALDKATNKSVVLVLGKGDETSQIIYDQKMPFSDKEVILELLG